MRRCVRAALLRARHTVFIVGWDVDSRSAAAPRHARGSVPARVSPRRHNLRIYVLAWDFAMIYALERDWPPVYRAAGGYRVFLDSASARRVPSPEAGRDRRPARVRRRLDLTRARWEHRTRPATRVATTKTAPYAPFHDVQAMFAATRRPRSASRRGRAGGRRAAARSRSARATPPRAAGRRRSVAARHRVRRARRAARHRLHGAAPRRPRAGAARRVSRRLAYIAASCSGSTARIRAARPITRSWS